VNANDKTLTQITSPQTGPQMFDPEWSADGTEIVTSGGSSTPANGNDIFVMKADGTGQVNLTNHPGSDTFPAWQP
jgi:Tol biopolymer transport system component